MHFLTLPARVELGPQDAVDAGEYVVDDVNAAQLLVIAGGGAMRLAHFESERQLDPAADYNGRKILVMRAGGFGDLVLLTPVLREIKRRWPACILHVSTMAHYAAVLATLPYVDEILPYPLPVDVARDHAVQIFFENAVERNPRAHEIHMTELFAEIAGVVVAEDLLKPDYRVKATEAIWANEAYPRTSKRRACIQVGASAALRVYPRELMGQIVGKLLKDGWEVFLLGAHGEIKLPDSPRPGLRNLSAAGLTFRQSCAVVAQSDCLIGGDSALVHIAGALDVPAVALYGPFPWKLRTAHSPSVHAIQGHDGCEPCFHHVNPARKDYFPAHCPSRAKGHCQVLAAIEPARVVVLVGRVARQIPQGAEQFQGTK